ncbi:DNA repair protein RadC [Endozoicomonas sp. G2_1]|uniref:JAB domain-containing protein n=1 Tax=Endozoicomonas sp. G2_1 TaxID=2821091 RepID=UPI001ADCACFF|nr:DNA repair protein RadC [Endozoicomonas sp. G2_1]
MSILREIEIRYRFSKTNCTITDSLLDAPDKVYDLFKFLQYEAKEQFIVVNFTNKYRVMNYEMVAKGMVNHIAIRPAEILRSAIALNAPAIILVHNHPSGDPEPSDADINITRKVKEVAESLAIEVLDHIVIGLDKFVSLKQIGKV